MLGLVRTPIAVAELIDKVRVELEVSAEAVQSVVSRFVSNGILITDLRPPSTCQDGLAHLRRGLLEANASAISGLRPLLAELRQIAEELDCGRITTGTKMRDLAEVEHPVSVDVRVGATMVLPRQVAVEAANAATALVCLSPHPDGDPGWKAYHERFMARFGANAAVPLTLLVDPVAGIGYPDHFTAPTEDLPRELSVRDTRLLALAQQAALEGSHEVVLDEGFLASLREGSEILRIPPHLELFTQLWAPSLSAVEQDDFRLVVSGIARTGTALSGRFIDLLPEEDQRHRRAVYGRLPTYVEGAAAAHLSFPPVHPHLENVVRAPQLLPRLVTMAEHRPEADDRFRLDDLAVTADARGMYLFSRSSGQVVEPMLANAGARHVMPPMARLLFEIPRARLAASSPFAWGAARCLPFLPRIVFGRSILSTARWTIPSTALPDPDLAKDRWRTEFDTLRGRLRLPGTISVGDSDLRLRLNLDDAMDLAVLRDHLDQARAAGKPLVIAEGATPADHGWFDGRANELIIPVASNRPTAPTPTILTRQRPPALMGPRRGVLPGAGHLLMAKLYTDPALMDTVLVHKLPDLLSQWPVPPSWWFVRYRDPEPHLRIRIHTDDQTSAFARISAWAVQLRDGGFIRVLTFNTHLPETARYGEGAIQHAAEALFAADSAAALAHLAALDADRSIPPQALLAASMVDLTSHLVGGVEAGARWLIDHPYRSARDRPDRNVAALAVRLSQPGAIAALKGGRLIANAWANRAHAAAAYRHHLDGEALKVEETIVPLTHMLHIRCAGINLAGERLCRRLARAAALAWISRTPAGER
ncbi:lantibiotic dehydratase [Actinomadura meridiana]|uniref:Lantibiotic dehydratase n=1 Tax=Actinomadura meridiana TaxID=559626 RepID=A0ABP8CHB0_9ACTN